MVGYGWTEAHLHEACRYVSKKLVDVGGVSVMLRHFEVKTYDCRRGNSTISFALCFGASTAKHKGEYPAGSAYTTRVGRRLLPKQPIPTAEVMNIRKSERCARGRQYVDELQTRSTSSLCWHSFGHFMAKLFDLNPDGKLTTGANTYDGRADFQAIAGHNKDKDRHECDCWDNGLMHFFEVRE